MRRMLWYVCEGAFVYDANLYRVRFVLLELVYAGQQRMMVHVEAHAHHPKTSV